MHDNEKNWYLQSLSAWSEMLGKPKPQACSPVHRFLEEAGNWRENQAWMQGRHILKSGVFHHVRNQPYTLNAAGTCGVPLEGLEWTCANVSPGRMSSKTRMPLTPMEQKQSERIAMRRCAQCFREHVINQDKAEIALRTAGLRPTLKLSKLQLGADYVLGSLEP